MTGEAPDFPPATGMAAMIRAKTISPVTATAAISRAAFGQAIPWAEKRPSLAA